MKKPLALIAVSVLGSACNGLSVNAPINFEAQPLAQNALSPAQLPTFHAGDKYYYTNGARDTVTDVNGDDITFFSRSKRKSVYSRNLFIPYKYNESSSRRTTKKTNAVNKSLWPLAVGNEDKYYTEASYVTTDKGYSKDYRQIWKCEVEGTAQIRIIAGNFDTYRVTCERYSDSGKRYQKSTWFYAPEMQTYVLRRDFYFSSKKERFRELTAVRPSLDGMARTDRNGLISSWQNALENSLSGKKTTWENKTRTVRAEVVPLSTFKAENGQYCRSYRQYLTRDGETRTYGGVACRTGKLKWRTPRRG